MENDDFSLQGQDLCEIAIQTNTNGIAFTNSEFKIVYGNDTFCNFIGNEFSKIKNQNIWNFLKPDLTVERVIEQLQTESSLTLTGTIGQIEGDNFDLVINILKVETQKNKPSYIFQIKDVSDEITLEDVLSNSLMRYKQLFEHSTSGIIILQPDLKGISFTIKDLNKEAQLIERVDKEAVINSKFDKNLPGIYTDELYELVKKVYQTGKSELFQTTCLTNEEEKIWKEYSIFKLSNGEIILLVNDQTEKYQAKFELIKSKERLESILRIYELKSTSKMELIHISLEEAAQLSESEFVVYFNFNPLNKELTHINLSNKGYKYCNFKNVKPSYSLDEMGKWADAIREGIPILKNEVTNNDFFDGLPFANYQIKRCLILPIKNEESIVSVIGLFNKKENYNNTDILQIQLLVASVLQMFEFKEYQENYFRIKIKAEQSEELKSAFLKEYEPRNSDAFKWNYRLDRIIIT